MQTDIPVQLGETSITAALRRQAHDLNACVTHTTDGGHAPGSLHFVGRAVDLADYVGPLVDDPRLLAINQHVLATVPHHFIQELIYAGPNGVCMYHGGVVNGLAVYGATTMSIHHNHVHLGVTTDYAYASPAPVPTQGVKPMWSPALQVVAFLPYWRGSGGYMLFADGGIGAVGDAPYRGAESQPLGHPYWVGRQPADLQRLGADGYAVLATSGERYEYPA